MTFQWENSSTEIVFSGDTKLPTQKILAVCDCNTRPYIPSGLSEDQVILLPPGEKAKTWSSVENILKRAVSLGMDRSSCFIGVGGGVICDLTAFAASVFMRGADLILKPTTLLAMVDASLGGKTGFDFMGFKNLVGTFYPARELWIDTRVLETLPEKEYRGGLAEVIKTAMLGDADLLELLENQVEAVIQGDPEITGEMVRRCLTVKGSIVEKDLREGGNRAVLNLGHTFAHALETLSNFTWAHGEAVGWGLLMACRLAGLEDYARRIESLLVRFSLPCEVKNLNPESFVEAMAHDKKNRGGTLRIVLPGAPGSAFIRETSRDELISFLESVAQARQIN